MSLQDAKQISLPVNDEPTVEELEREYKQTIKEIKDLTRHAIQTSRAITRKKKYREWVK